MFYRFHLLVLNFLCISGFLLVGELAATESQTVNEEDVKISIANKPIDTCANNPTPGCKDCCPIHGTKAHSTVDYITMNHIHDASDYTVGTASGSGCSACGAGGASDTITSVQVQRFHRFRDMTEQSSFSPGVFQNYDVNLRCVFEEGHNEFQLFLFFLFLV